MRFLTIRISKKVCLNIMIGLMVIVIAAAVWVSYFMTDPVSSSQRLLPIYSVQTDQKQVSITFDAAWDADDTRQLIEILNRYEVPATFFCVGDFIDRHPDAVRQLSKAGHTIANHSDAHLHLDAMNKAQFMEDVRSCNQKIEAITNVPVQFYRGPYGEYNNMSVQAIEEMEMYYIQWDCDSIDWKEGITVQQIADNALKNTKNGSIFLFHNGLANTPAALELVLQKLTDDGYSFVSLSDLIYKDHYTIDAAGRQHASS